MLTSRLIDFKPSFWLSMAANTESARPSAHEVFTPRASASRPRKTLREGAIFAGSSTLVAYTIDLIPCRHLRLKAFISARLLSWQNIYSDVVSRCHRMVVLPRGSGGGISIGMGLAGINTISGVCQRSPSEAVEMFWCRGISRRITRRAAYRNHLMTGRESDPEVDVLVREAFQAYSPMGPLATKKKVASRLRGSWRVLRRFIVVLHEAWPLVAAVEEISPMGIHPQGDGRPRAPCPR